jgi:hypothetical protein
MSWLEDSNRRLTDAVTQQSHAVTEQSHSLFNLAHKLVEARTEHYLPSCMASRN